MQNVVHHQFSTRHCLKPHVLLNMFNFRWPMVKLNTSQTVVSRFRQSERKKNILKLITLLCGMWCFLRHVIDSSIINRIFYHFEIVVIWIEKIKNGQKCTFDWKSAVGSRQSGSLCQFYGIPGKDLLQSMNWCDNNWVQRNKLRTNEENPLLMNVLSCRIIK